MKRRGGGELRVGRLTRRSPEKGWRDKYTRLSWLIPESGLEGVRLPRRIPKRKGSGASESPDPTPNPPIKGDKP